MKAKYTIDWLFQASMPTSLKKDWTLEDVIKQTEKEDKEDYEKKTLNLIGGLFGGSIARSNPDEYDRMQYPDKFISFKEQETN